jgi:hypothetical protein
LATAPSHFSANRKSETQTCVISTSGFLRGEIPRLGDESRKKPGISPRKTPLVEMQVNERLQIVCMLRFSLFAPDHEAGRGE